MGPGADGIGRRGDIGERHEEGGDLNRLLVWRTRRQTTDDAGQTTQGRRRSRLSELEQTRRARRGREQDFAEISRRMYEEIRSSRDPRGHVEDG